MLRAVVDPIIALLYPQQCHVCSGDVESMDNGIACEQCWQATRIFDGSEPLCEKCGAMLASRHDRCLHCVDTHFDRAIAIGVYEKALAATVVRLKKVPHLPARTNRCLIERIARMEADGPSIIIPIPLSKRRSIERGFNQAEIVARVIARSTGTQIFSNCLVRSAHTPIHRIGMDKKAREATVKNAFTVRSPRLVDGRDVILVDDVLTSGSTASACAKELKKNGAGRVTVVTLARAVMRQ
ncbi:MAG TPA: ComF family protein [Pyrinomonadaceae bacterium]|nr:ComF family protein [Pyrinomonadaceae bacterium]